MSNQHSAQEFKGIFFFEQNSTEMKRTITLNIFYRCPL